MNFAERASLVHNNFYDYSKVKYINTKTKVEIICPIHGSFWQMPDKHLRGKGCPTCGLIRRVKSRTFTTEKFIEKAESKFGNKYDYSKVKYINTKTKVEIICPIHGSFWQTPDKHLNSCGCPICGRNQGLKNRTKSTDEFIAEASLIHGNSYDYSKVKYTSIYSKVLIICQKCNREFLQTPHDHLCGSGCPYCKSSKGEEKIASYLALHNIRFERQKRFKFIKSQKMLPLDFYLPDYNICIEYNGIQHYEPVAIFGGEKQLHLQRYLDWLKRKNCLENGIIFFAIKYDEDIKKALDDLLYLE